MPKLVLAKWRNNDERMYLCERTKMYNEELKAFAGSSKVKYADIAAFLGCSKRTVSRYMEGIKTVGSSRGTFNAIDVARRLAEREAGLA